jgi:hypothetical protein
VNQTATNNQAAANNTNHRRHDELRAPHAPPELITLQLGFYTCIRCLRYDPSLEVLRCVLRTTASLMDARIVRSAADEAMIGNARVSTTLKSGKMRWICQRGTQIACFFFAFATTGLWDSK